MNGQYTVAQLATIAGVTVRTLHHYDEIGLLRPPKHSASGYRLYGRAELLRLQQILFFRELDIPLGEIRHTLNAKDFDPVASLEEHRARLLERSRRLKTLVATIDRTISYYRKENGMLSDAEIYDGLSNEQIHNMKTESRERWGKERVESAERKMKGLSKTELAKLKADSEALTRELAALVGKDPASKEAQALIARHHAGIEFFYKANAEVYKGLGRLYLEDERFAAYYEKFASGMAAWMEKAMTVYADAHLS